MTAWTLVVVLLAGAATSAPCQDLALPQTLLEAQRDIEYADLLNAAQLTTEQLDALLEAQSTMQAEAALGPDEAAALAEIRWSILRGLSREQAMAALGARQQVVGQAQQRLEQLLQTSATNLAKLLTPEQRSAIAWTGTPAHAFDGVVGNLGNWRAAPDAQWQQIRAQVSQMIAQMAAQADPTAKVTPEQVGALLDAARGLDDQAFEAKRATLPREWAQALMPGIIARLANPQFQEQQVGMVLRQLLTHERGQLLVQAKRDALGAP